MNHSLAFSLPVHKFWRNFVCILMWIILIGAVVVPQSLYAQFEPPRNHYKTWRIQPIQGSGLAVEVKDQFMTDFLQVLRIDYLSNPVVKDDTFRIIKPDNHLTWYRVSGRDTLINLEYVNQFEPSAKIEIDSVHYLLVPTQKVSPLSHPPPESLDHYKAYRIRNPSLLNRPVKLLDQFDERIIGAPEFITSLKPVYFLTPAQKKRGPVPEPVFDTITHYVAYEIQPPRTLGLSVQTQDQFISPNFYNMFVQQSELLLVPTKKILVTPSQEACCFPDGSCGLVPVGTCPGIVVPACLGDLNGNGIDDACEPPPPPDTLLNHFKTWRLESLNISLTVKVQDQFMTDSLRLRGLDYLSNPVRKTVGGITYDITRPNDHLLWYPASGRDTLLKVEYVNQYESTTVLIDTVRYFLVPTKKDPHPAPDSLLGHYKCYQIRNPQQFTKMTILEDQFDRVMGITETINMLTPVYFCTPARKNNEPSFGPDTHYVAYEIIPKTPTSMIRNVANQFGPLTVTALQSELLLVPTKKRGVEPPQQEACCFQDGSCGLVPVGTCPGIVVPACLGDLNGNGIDDACEPPHPPDTLRNHFKTWRILTQPVNTFAFVKDQFIQAEVKLDTIDFLSNPVRKIVFVPPVYDTSDIRRPNDHLTWYRAKSLAPTKRFKIGYVNQFESTKVVIDTLKYLLVPTQKDPHPKPDSLLGHYTTYKIKKPKGFSRPVQLQDQFDLTPEFIDSLVPVYFLTPAQKNNEPRFEPDTHYVAYEIFPKRVAPQTRTTLDQFGSHSIQIRQSELLLVPTNKVSVKYFKAGDANGDGVVSISDVVYLINYLFKGGPPPDPLEAGDANCDGLVSIADVIYLINYLFKGGPPPC